MRSEMRCKEKKKKKGGGINGEDEGKKGCAMD